MQRRARKVLPSTDPELLKAEAKAQKELRNYVEKKHGNQKYLAEATGINATFISKLCRKKGQVIALETAILIELATGLSAEMLCPSRADVIARFLAARMPKDSPCSTTA